MTGNHNTDIPRPEYPRPDFQRGTSEGIDWICLNGTWEFAFDPDDIGEENRWFSPESTTDSVWTSQIQVPYPWESLAAWREEAHADNVNYLSKKGYLTPEEVTCGGLERTGNYREAPRHTIGWYRKTVSVPETWGEKRTILTFGAIDWHAKVWVNGECIGEHENGYLPFELDITDALSPGEPAHIVVRAYDAEDHSEQLAGKQIGWYARASGIWQTVYLEPRNPTHIKACYITPDIDNSTATLDITIDGEGAAGTTLDWHCVSPVAATGSELSGRIAVEENSFKVRIDIPQEHLHLWDVDTPYLYNLTLTLTCGDQKTRQTSDLEIKKIDRVFTYFGMRKVSIAKAPDGDYQYIYLNNRPVYLLGALNQSFNPEGVYTFLTDEAIRRDIERAKEFGFNFLRLHIKVDEPRLYYWADKLGMLFMCDIPNFGDYTEKAQTRFEETLRGTIARDYNHPSIISWCNFNETWGLGGREYKDMTERQEWVREMYHLAKSLDETRLIEDNSPCLYDHVETDINSWHFYINDYEQAKEHIANVVAETYPGSAFNYVGGNVQSDAPLINSEYGGISAGAGDKDVSWCFKYLTNELRIHPKICGYVYTELQDIEWEHNGFMNYDRSIKEFGYDYLDINALDFIAIDYPPGTTVAPGDEIKADIYASHFSHKTLTETTLHWQLDTMSATGHITRGCVSGRVEIPFPQYQVQRVHELGLVIPNIHPAVGTLHIWVTDGTGSVVARNFINLEHFVADAAPVESEGSKSVVLNYAPGNTSESAWGEPTLNAQLFSAVGSGYVEYKIPLPDGRSISDISKMELIFEASSSYGGARQTEPEKHPSDVTIAVNGVEIDTLHIPDCPADIRGALSYIHGEPGIYGYLYNVKVDPSRLMGQETDTLTVRYEVKTDADAKGGLALYGGRMGRYPTGPHAIIHF